jgi:ADP-ribosylglycohydrolase
MHARPWACSMRPAAPSRSHTLLLKLPGPPRPQRAVGAHRYADDFAAGVLANANVGGENCHRGAVVGALLGAAAGERAIPASLRDGLAASADVRSEIDAFMEALQSCAA